eukprot:s8167_g1.t1
MWQTAFQLLAFSQGMQPGEATFNSAIPLKGGLWMAGLGWAAGPPTDSNHFNLEPGARAELTADQKLDELLEDLKKEENQARASSAQQPNQPGEVHGAPTQPEQRLVAADGLSHQDLLEIEAIKMEALRGVQEKLKREMARRRDAAVSGGSGDS